MLGDEESIFFLSEERTNRVEAGPPAVGFAPELSIEECRRLCLMMKAPLKEMVEKASTFWRLAKNQLEEIDKYSDPVGLNLFLGELASLIPAIFPENLLPGRRDKAIHGAIYIARNSIEWVDLILDSASLFGRGDELNPEISESVKQAMCLSLQIAHTGARSEESVDIPWPGRFPASLADFALIGRYRNKPTAIARLRDFLTERCGATEGKERFDEWTKRGLESWEWFQYGIAWKDWSEAAMRKAKNRAGGDEGSS